MPNRLTWGDESLALEIAWAEDGFPYLSRLTTAAGVAAVFVKELPLVELISVAHGHVPANDRLVQTRIGSMLRYESHSVADRDGVSTLRLRMLAEAAGVAVEFVLSSPAGLAALTSSVSVTNVSAAVPVVLRSVTSWVSPFGYCESASDEPDFDAWHLVSGRSDWLAEGRWKSEQLRGSEFPRMAQHLTGHNPRGAHSVVSTGTWSTGKQLPVGGLVSESHGLAWLWQVEHNGAWRWEVGENSIDGYVALSGPTEIDHDWTVALDRGESFSTVPVTVVAATGLDAGIRELTAYRRGSRRQHADNQSLGVVFNDYMNTLNGDPTTQKLLPLIEAAADTGAEIFCIDAGWYDDSGHWWDSVGEWLPSTTRFPGGLAEVIDHIRRRGMVPGLWLEPEVVGVRSPAAQSIPDDAFFRKDGARIVEHDRYHLDLTHPAAVAHLDAVIDRLVSEFGIGFFKLDYNINPGAGTESGRDGSGAGLLAHNRAHSAWLDSVLDRHPGLILENCASGAMRTDWAMLSRMQLQSTSDQQDFRNYPPIAATAPLSMLPEQAASWAYPQPSMTDEELAFSLTTGLLGRFYLSGYLNRMTDDQRATVAEAVVANKAIRGDIARSTPFWPLGMPEWDAPWVALGLEVPHPTTPASRFVTIWNRSEQEQDVTLRLPDLAGTDISVRTVFPQRLPGWTTRWNARSGELHVVNPTGLVGARTLELRVADSPTA